MRVALVDPSLFTLPYDRALARGLAACGHEVTLHGRRLGPDDGDAEGVRLAADFYPVAASAPVARLPRRLRLGVKGLDHILSMWRLQRRLRGAARPDVIHFQWLPLPLADRRLLSGFRRAAPLVLTVHDTDPFNGNPASALQRRGVAACFAAFDRLIVHTAQGHARLLAEGVPAHRLSLLPHGLLAEPPAAAAAAPAVPTVLLFGKIKPYKGLDVLVEAFALLPPALRGTTRLRVVGKPYMELAPIRARIAALGLAGQVTIEPRFVADDEIPALFQAASIVACPYREIEASGVLALAIAHGRPIVASRRGGFAESLTDGVHGALVPPGEPAALAAALAALLGDPERWVRCAAAVRALAAVTPAWPAIAAATASVYAAARAGPCFTNSQPPAAAGRPSTRMTSGRSKASTSRP